MRAEHFTPADGLPDSSDMWASADGDWQSDDAPRQRQVHDSAPSPDLVRMYLNSLRDEPNLEAQEEVELAKTIEAGLIAAAALRYRGDSYTSRDEAVAERQKMYEAMRDVRHGQIVTYKMPDDQIAERFQTASDWASEYRYFVSKNARLPRESLEALAADGNWAKQELFERNTRLVVSIAKRYGSDTFQFLDRISWGNFGLLEAVEKFDYTKGVKFSTHATWWIKKNISRGFAAEGYAIPLSTYDDEKIMKVRRASNEIRQKGDEVTTEKLMAATGFSAEKLQDCIAKKLFAQSLDMPVTKGADRLQDSFTFGDLLLEDLGPEPPAEPHPEADTFVGEILGKLDEESRALIILSKGLFGNKPLGFKALGEALAEHQGRPQPFAYDAMRKRITKAEERMRQVALELAGVVLDDETEDGTVHTTSHQTAAA